MRRVPARPFLVALGTLLLVLAAGVADAAQLSGTVRSAEDGEPLPFANVVVVGTTYGAVTENDGTFVLEVPAGRYQVMATYVSYSSSTQQVTVGRDGATVEFRLDPEATEMSEITIYGQRELVDVTRTSTVRSVGGEQARSMPVDEVQAVVGRQVGVSLYDDEIFIRGGRYDEAVFVVDGVVVKDYVSGQSRAGDLSSQSLAEVNVLTGGYAAEYGQALSGVINVTTREGGDEHHGYIGWTTDHPGGDWDGFRSDITTLSLEGPLFRDDSPRLLGGLRLPGRMTYFVQVEGRISDTYLPGWSQSGPPRRSSYVDSFLGHLFSYGSNLATRADSDWQFLGKFAWKMSPTDKLSLSLNKTLGINSGFFYRQIIRRDPTSSTNYPWQFHERLDHYLTFTEDKAVLSGIWTHHFNGDTFQELRLSRFFTNDHHDVNGKPWFEYVEPFDDELLTGDPHPYFIDSGDFPLWHDHSIEEITADWDLTAIGDRHRWKTGFEHSFQNVQFIDIQRPWQEDPDGLGGQHDLYNVHPQVGAAYVQDRIEYEGVVAQFGLRFDYWYPGREVEAAIADTNRVGTTPSIQRAFQDDTFGLFGHRLKARWSPRVSVSHPITERDHLFFNYGRFAQWPTYFYVYSKIGSVSSEDFPLIGNLNLDPEVSTQFEIGGAHQFRDDLALNVTLFFKDQYDYPVAVRRSTLGQGDVFIYDNLHYGRSRGIELELEKRPAPYLGTTIGYTYQISTALSSDPNESQEQQELEGAAAQIGLEEGFTYWNRPHRVTAAIEFRVRRGDRRPRVPLIGIELPDDLSFHLYYEGQSGRAYTPEDLRGERTGEYYSKNAEFEHRIDLKLQRSWQVWGTRLTGTLDIRNVLNHRHPRRIDPSTGERPEDGVGQWMDPPSDEASRLVREAILANPSYLSTPRQTRIGVGLTW